MSSLKDIIIDSHHKFKSAHREVRELLDKKAKKILKKLKKKNKAKVTFTMSIG